MSKQNIEKATAAVEDIFAHAVALTQANRLKNTVYCKDNWVFILNYDNTILLRFELPEWNSPFKNPVSFNANDYDSNTFYEEDGKIIFVSEVGGVERKKTISVPGASPDEIEQMFFSYASLETCSVNFHRKMLEALDEKLSHIELSVRDGTWKLIQRDIYSGSVIELTELKKGLKRGKSIDHDVGPIGIRTNDFIALFSFSDRVTFYLDPEHREYATVTGNKYGMTGTIAFCVYDEVGDIKPVKVHQENKESIPIELPKGRFREGTIRGVKRRRKHSKSTPKEKTEKPGKKERSAPRRGRRRK